MKRSIFDNKDTEERTAVRWWIAVAILGLIMWFVL